MRYVIFIGHARLGLRACGRRERVAVDRPERTRRAARRQREGRSADHLHRPTASSSTCSPGTRSMRSHRPAPARRSSSSWTMRGLGEVPYSKRGRRSAAVAAPTTAPSSPGRSPPARRPTARTGRSRPGSGCCRITASRPSPSSRCGSFTLWPSSGDLPVLTIGTDWAWHQWDHLYGTYTYAGKPVYGFKSTSAGNPLDSFGRNIYVDTFDSGVRRRLEAGEQLPRAQRHRRLLLQLQPARLASGRQGCQVPRHGRRAGRHP